MDETTEPFCGVRFSKVGKVYHFIAGDDGYKGWRYGGGGDQPRLAAWARWRRFSWMPIHRRRAGSRSTAARPHAICCCARCGKRRNPRWSTAGPGPSRMSWLGIKIVSAEYSFDGSRLTILFSSETEEKYDLKSLRQDMQEMFGLPRWKCARWVREMSPR